MTVAIQPRAVPEPLPVPGDQELSQLGRAAYRQARRFGAGREDAEDIAQDVVTLLVAGHAVAIRGTGCPPSCATAYSVYIARR